MWIASALAALTLIQTHTWVQAGPAFTGSRVSWTTNTAGVYTSQPVNRVWQAPAVQPDRVQRLTAVSGSSLRVAFIRRVERLQHCDVICPHGPRPVERSDVLAGPPRGPFRRLNRGLALDVDVDGSRIIYSDTGRVVLDRRTLASADGVEYPDVALAGRFAAWTEVPRGQNFIYAPRALVVYDVRAGRIAYRLVAAPFVDIDLAADGTVAFGEDPTPVGGPNGGVAWASVAEPWPHYLPGDAIPYEIRIASGRIASFGKGELTVRTLAGAAVASLPAAYGAFDFDGRRLAYLQAPKVIAVASLR